MRTAVIAATLVALGCSSSTRGAGSASGSGSESGSGAGSGSGAAAAPRLGDACASDRACPDDARCAPLPGGACTAPCPDGTCPDDAACVPTAAWGDLCLAACTADADCRAGYACDAARRACVPPAVAAPALPECPEPPVASSTRPPSTRWQPMDVLTSSTTPGAYQLEPAAAVSTDGSLVIVHTGGPATSDLGVIRVPTSGPAVESALPTGAPTSRAPAIGGDRLGALHAVWLGHDGDARGARIGYARSTDRGATWTAPIAVHDAADCAADAAPCVDRPLIATGLAPRVGRAAPADVVRLFYTAGNAGVRMRTSRDGGQQFDPPVAVVAGVGADVALDPRGGVHVVAMTGGAAWGSADNALVYVRAIDGTTFTPAVAVSGPGESVPLAFAAPSLVTDPTGMRVHVAYVVGGSDGAWNLMLATSTDGGASWSRQLLAGATPACTHHAVPELAMRRSGKLLATWYQYQDGAGYRAFTTCERTGTGCRPPAPLGPPMATYDLVGASPRSVGERSALVIDEPRRRLHAVWTQVLGESPRGIARIAHAVGSGN